MTADPLITRIEAATEGSRELDCEVMRALGWKCRGSATEIERVGLIDLFNWDDPRGKAVGTLRDNPLTTSLDAITREIEARGHYVSQISKENLREPYCAVVSFDVDEPKDVVWSRAFTGEHNNIVLALCIALLNEAIYAAKVSNGSHF